MKGLSRIVMIPGLMILAGLLSASCIRVDQAPGLSVMVIDVNDNPVQGAMVALFDNQTEWHYLDNPAQVWRVTGISGEVLFTDLEEKSYYVYARKGSDDNRGDEMLTSGSLMSNQVMKVSIRIR